MVTVFDKEFFDLFTTDVTLALSIDSRKGRVGFEGLTTTNRLPLSLNRRLFLRNSDHETGEARAYD